ncbi:hypothetical protein AYO38_05790 [bacterium SCGC AG-212-C10]|nr:hypothetical protein AYO38_05790 [bacterium SCGC AG-212-C10]
MTLTISVSPRQAVVAVFLATFVALTLVAVVPTAYVLAQAGDEAPAAVPLSTAFTYQGRLERQGEEANGLFDFQFRLYDDIQGGTELASMVPANGVQVADGLFAVTLGFGGAAFNGDERFLDIMVSQAGANQFESLGRQRLTATPYAIFASSAPWTGITGVPAAIADGNVWSLNGNAGTVAGTNFLGTVDETAFEIRVNSLRALRITPGNETASIVGGNAVNFATGPGGFIGGGGRPGLGNTNSVASFGTVGGGYGNVAGTNAFVGGGFSNTADGQNSVIAGGQNNKASKFLATVGGGSLNEASGAASTVAGGENNIASELDATVGGGTTNQATGSASTVVGGSGNKAGALYSTVLGGQANVANGVGSVALGQGAQLNSGAAGSFLFSDAMGGGTFSVPNAATFDVENGLRVVDNAGSSKVVGLGQFYRDNSIWGWGKIQINGSGTPVINGGESFNVGTVSDMGVGWYRVALFAPATAPGMLIPMAMAESDCTPPNCGARYVSIDQLTVSTFDIHVYNSAGTLVDNDVTFIVTGR